jgi:hypothetical protein
MKLFFVYRHLSFFQDYKPFDKLWRKTKGIPPTASKYFPALDRFKSGVIDVLKKYMREAAEITRPMKTLRGQAGPSAIKCPKLFFSKTISGAYRQKQRNL